MPRFNHDVAALATFFLSFISPALAAKHTTQMSGCEEARDRLQVRLEIAQKTQEQRDAQLADVVVRYGRLEIELKALKQKLAKMEEK